MPKGPKGEKRPADVVGAAIKVAKIATGEVEEGTDGKRWSASRLDGLIASVRRATLGMAIQSTGIVRGALGRDQFNFVTRAGALIGFGTYGPRRQSQTRPTDCRPIRTCV